MAYPINSFQNPIAFVLCYLCYIFGFVIFVYGLISPTVVNLPAIPMKFSLKECPSAFNKDLCIFQDTIHLSRYFNHSQKVVIYIIDALRADFIPYIKSNPKFNTTMHFTENLLKNNLAVSYITQGFAPTVTLPRIKTLVTGTISNFLDVIINFNAFKLNSDNILKQASLAGFKSIFYGDDTWLKLFPDLFIRSEGTHSFFVSDFMEVDYNVSRHVKLELNNTDWSIMILHFLGVDHIGHAYSPSSDHLPNKLIEMDEIIKLIYEKLKSTQPPALIIVCGDHGMTTSGSHGGITQDELLTPLIFINTADQTMLHAKSSSVIDQVDFTPTLSAILGVPIPVNNFGQIIPGALEFMGFSEEEILYAAYYNLLQLSKVYKVAFSKEIENINLVKEITTNHLKWLNNKENILDNTDYLIILKSYCILLNEIKQELLSTVSGYNEFSMIIGIIIIWISLFFSFYSLYPINTNKVTILKISCKRISNLCAVVPIVCIYLLYSKTYFELIFIPLFFILFLASHMIYLLLKSAGKECMSYFGKIYLFLFSVHALSLFSSSYIEEEHQTWYFLVCTIAILLFWKKISLFQQSLNTDTTHIYDFSLLWSECSSTVYIIFTLLVSHRIVRKWNQVGNKWQHLPDLSDWLNQKENRVFLGFSIILSLLVMVIYIRKLLSSLNYSLFFSGIVCVSLQKIGICAMYLDLSAYTTVLTWIVYFLIILISFFTFIQMYFNALVTNQEKIKSFVVTFISIWLLLIAIIGRAHNIPLLSIVLLQELLLSKVLTQDHDIIITVASYLIMAMSSFFYYGNSNSLSTIDVFTGYTGVQSYMPSVIAVLLICNTYSTLVLWLMILLYRLLEIHNTEDFKSRAKKIKLVFLFLLDYKLFILALYCIVMYLMRHHLFIFSVFFPKLFYELCFVILFSAISAFFIFIVDKAQ